MQADFGRKSMRTLILALTAFAIAVPTYAQRAPTRTRDCLRNIESGIPAPVSTRADAKWLYIASVMLYSTDGSYGNTTGWKVAHSLKEACDVALDDLAMEPSVKGREITGAIVMQVPDSIVRQAIH